jgi:hypothetical protein
VMEGVAKVVGVVEERTAQYGLFTQEAAAR